MPDIDDPNIGPEEPDVPIPPNYPAPKKARTPAITAGVKTKASNLSPMADGWAASHTSVFGEPLPILTASVDAIVLGSNKRVSVLQRGIRYARPTMVFSSTPGVVWKQEDDSGVKTWVLVLEHPSRKYTVDDADALAEIIQSGLIKSYRVGKVMTGDESWYDNAKDLPDYTSVPVVNWPWEVSQRDANIRSLNSDVIAAKQGEHDARESACKAKAAHGVEMEGIHQIWRKDYWVTHLIYIILLVILIIGCLLRR